MNGQANRGTPGGLFADAEGAGVCGVQGALPGFVARNLRRTDRIARGEEVQFFVPGEPVAKGRPRMTRAGRAYTPAKTRGYEQLVKLAAAQAMRGAPPMEGPVAVIIAVSMPIPVSWSQKKRAAALAGSILPGVRPDLDNVVKSATDGMNLICYADDAQIVYISALKAYSNVIGVSIIVRKECANG